MSHTRTMPPGGPKTPLAASIATQPFRYVPDGWMDFSCLRNEGQRGRHASHCTSQSVACLPACPPGLPQGGVGAREPVTVGQCALACLGAPGCEGFTYNAAQQVRAAVPSVHGIQSLL